MVGLKLFLVTASRKANTFSKWWSEYARRQVSISAMRTPMEYTSTSSE